MNVQDRLSLGSRERANYAQDCIKSLFLGNKYGSEPETSLFKRCFWVWTKVWSRTLANDAERNALHRNRLKHRLNVDSSFYSSLVRSSVAALLYYIISRQLLPNDFTFTINPTVRRSYTTIDRSKDIPRTSALLRKTLPLPSAASALPAT